ncbi:hypothetical protein B0T17DRAFT_488585 [Bombardia bombarda]|uniref:Alkyl hydroperoxide reductase subunit C/ Thiol specific antioxidant domain-containing protein n=1 Tax=Bombardia bombarda TaxID=252184 RepID=A0AA39XB16_9PEZI|nr:hypothetical protein B0T17DRAFT_488585 [Bombardia bombarda]
MQELQSLRSPPGKDVAPVPQVGDRAPSLWPSSEKIGPFPSPRPVLVVFLRHCGCPFAEKTLGNLTALSIAHPSLHCIAVSHSSQAATDSWVMSVGGAWDVDVVVDEQRDLYAQWGLGLSTAWHAVLGSASTLYSAYCLGRNEGIWNGATESGNRWQMGGAYAIDASGFVRWAHVGAATSDVPDFEEALAALRRARGTGRGAGGLP